MLCGGWLDAAVSRGARAPGAEELVRQAASLRFIPHRDSPHIHGLVTNY